MKFISVRKINNPDEISEVDILGTFNEQTMSITEGDIYEDLPQERVMLFVHGYNNDYTKTFNTYRDMKQKLDIVLREDNKYEYVGFLWAGGDFCTDYIGAKHRAKLINSRLSYHLQRLYTKSGNRKIDIICHSLGCFVVLESLKHLALC